MCVRACARVCGTIRRMLKVKARIFSQLKVCKVVVVSAVLFRCEAWILKNNEHRQQKLYSYCP